MTHAEIVFRLSRLIDEPTSDVLYSININQLITAIAHRMGEDALSLTQSDLELARKEVIAAINHGLDYRPFIEEALDVWEITRKL